MSLLGSVAARADNTGVWMYGLLNPTTGANNVLVSVTGAPIIRTIVASYTDVLQSGLPDAVGSLSNQGTITSLSGTLTPVLDNCFVAQFNYGNTDVSIAAAAGATSRNTADINCIFMDSGTAVTPVAAKVETANYTNNSTIEAGLVMASFAPAFRGRNLDLTSKYW